MQGRVNFNTLDLFSHNLADILHFGPYISTLELSHSIFSPDVTRNNSLKPLFPGIFLSDFSEVI